MSVGKIGEFDVKNGNWERYVERLEMYFKINKITDAERVPMLITMMGDATYELLSDLLSPQKPSNTEYRVIVSTLQNHLQPKVSVMAERYKFRQRRQAVTEGVSDYLTELKKLSRNCDFGAGLDDNLRDQLVCGLKSDATRQRLFAEDNLSFSRAVKLASALEAAERDAAAVELRVAGSFGETAEAAAAARGGAVHALASSRPRGAVAARGSASTFTAAVPRRGEQPVYCRACGARDHDSQNCRFKEAVCSKCKRKGHLRRVCSEYTERGGRPGEAGYGGGWRHGSRQFYHLEAASLDQNEEAQDEQLSEVEEEIHQLCLSGYKPV